MMSRPEWDLALICDESGISPAELNHIILGLCESKLKFHNEVSKILSHDQLTSIFSAAKAAGAIIESVDIQKPPDERSLHVSHKALDILIRDVNLIFDVLPDAKNRFCSNRDFRIAATIPGELNNLEGFFRKFENTALGIRRIIAEARSQLTILVPFMDSGGLMEILPSLEKALERNVKILILTRELANGGRNMTALSSLVDTAIKAKGELRLYEAVLSNKSPISHAKVISKDGGEEVYIGSANLTTASMEKTIEVGVFLKGNDMERIDEFLDNIKALSKRCWP